MNYRMYQENDLSEIVDLFYQSIHSINSNIYSTEQQHAWAPYKDLEKRKELFSKSLSINYTFVVEENHNIVGFIDMEKDGHIDCLYIHPDYQKRGIATNLIQIIEEVALKHNIKKLNVEASLLAKKLFLKEGFIIKKEQIVERQEVQLINYQMEKSLKL